MSTGHSPDVTSEELRLMTCVELGVACDEEVLSKRVEIAVNMVRKGLVGMELGAKAAGMRYEEFVREFKKRLSLSANASA